MSELIEFFKEIGRYNTEAFNYIESKKIIIEDKTKINEFVGVYPIIKNNILVEFRIMVPKIINLETLLMNIHEYGHATELYKNLNKTYKEDANEELIPILLEEIYCLENHKEKEFERIKKQAKIDIKNRQDKEKYLLAYKITKVLANKYLYANKVTKELIYKKIIKRRYL